jgi:hypothetical protein
LGKYFAESFELLPAFRTPRHTEPAGKLGEISLHSLQADWSPVAYPLNAELREHLLHFVGFLCHRNQNISAIFSRKLGQNLVITVKKQNKTGDT